MSTIVRRTGRTVTLFAFISLACAPLGCGEDTTSGGTSEDQPRADDIPADPPTTANFDDLDRDREGIEVPPSVEPATPPEFDGDGDDDSTSTPLDPGSPPELDEDDYESIDGEYPAGQFDDIIDGTDDSSDSSSGDGSDDGSNTSDSNGGDDTSGGDGDLCVSGDDTVHPTLPTASGSYGCTRTRGYWSTHHEDATSPGLRRDWPAPYDEDHEMCDRTLVSIIGSTGSQGLWYRLAAQWLAAVLNTSQASAPPDVAAALVDGKQLLTNHVRTIPSADRQKAERIKNLLDDYNNGVVGPGACP